MEVQMNRLITQSLFSFVLLLGTFGCNGLTFENEGRIDFQRYQSVTVLPITIEGIYQFDNFGATDDAYGYLVEELRASSGFRTVASNQFSVTDTELSVWISTREQYDYDTDEITYSVQTKFLLTDYSGVELYSGSSSESGTDLSATVNETLSEVSHFFLMPYRI
jgi:hypothetical protein